MNFPESIAVLVTGGGAPGVAGTIHALRHNPDGVPVRIVLVDARRDVVGRAWADTFHVVKPGGAPGYLEEMLELCGREKVDMVLPQTTREVEVLSANAPRFEAAGVRVCAAAGGAVRLANNKHDLLAVFERLGLPHPGFRLCRSTADLRSFASQVGYPEVPFVVKPPVSNGMRGYRKVCEDKLTLKSFLEEKPSADRMGLEDLEKILTSGDSFPEMLATEYLPGDEYSVDAFIGSRGAVAIPRIRQSIRSGISFENEIVDRDDLRDQTLLVAREIGLTGAFGFQFKLDAMGVPKPLECNPRVQGTMVASLFAGVNVIWLAVREVLGMPGEPPDGPLKRARFLRYWGGVAFTDERITII